MMWKQTQNITNLLLIMKVKCTRGCRSHIWLCGCRCHIWLYSCRCHMWLYACRCHIWLNGCKCHDWLGGCAGHIWLGSCRCHIWMCGCEFHNWFCGCWCHMWLCCLAIIIFCRIASCDYRFVWFVDQVQVNRHKIDVAKLKSNVRVIDKDVPRTDRDQEFFKSVQAFVYLFYRFLIRNQCLCQ